MSKVRKVVFVAAGALVACGVVALVAAFALARFNPQNLSTTARDRTPAQQALAPEAESPHNAIIVKNLGTSVRVEPADGGAVEIAHWESARRGESVAVTDRDGTVTVEGKSSLRLLPEISFFSEDDDRQERTAVVRIPASFDGDIRVSNGGYDVEAANVEGIASIDLASDNGSVAATDVQAGSVALASSNGNVEALRIEARALTTRANNGSVRLAEVVADTVSLHGDNGAQTIEDVTARTIDADNVNGSFHGSGLSVSEAARLSTNNGEIAASFVGSENDYRIDARTANGAARSPRGNDGAAALIDASSTNGSVTITFAGEGAEG